MNDYYFLDGQSRVGPYSGDMISELREKGLLRNEDYLWREGLSEWISVGSAFAPGGELSRLGAKEPDAAPHARPGHSKDSTSVCEGGGARPEARAMTGNTRKQQHIESIRWNTACPAYRSMIGAWVILGYIIALLHGLIILIASFHAMGEISFSVGLSGLFYGILSTVIIFYGVQLLKEVSLMIVDIAVSITDANSRDNQTSITADP